MEVVCGGVGFYNLQLPSPPSPASVKRAHMEAERGSGQLGLICMENMKSGEGSHMGSC